MLWNILEHVKLLTLVFSVPAILVKLHPQAEWLVLGLGLCRGVEQSEVCVHLLYENNKVYEWWWWVLLLSILPRHLLHQGTASSHLCIVGPGSYRSQACT